MIGNYGAYIGGHYPHPFMLFCCETFAFSVYMKKQTRMPFSEGAQLASIKSARKGEGSFRVTNLNPYCAAADRARARQPFIS